MQLVQDHPVQLTLFIKSNESRRKCPESFYQLKMSLEEKEKSFRVRVAMCMLLIINATKMSKKISFPKKYTNEESQIMSDK